jgi:hypothetical protein
VAAAARRRALGHRGVWLGLPLYRGAGLEIGGGAVQDVSHGRPGQGGRMGFSGLAGWAGAGGADRVGPPGSAR